MMCALRRILKMAVFCGVLLIFQGALRAQDVDDKTATLSNTIKWSTASEVANFGFDVYRSDQRDGAYQKINADVIRGAGTSDTPQHYVYVDDQIEPGKVYFYYVMSIAMDGTRQQFTPVVEAPPKGLAEDDPEHPTKKRGD